MALGEFGFQRRHLLLSLGRVAHARVKQEEMVEHLISLLVVGVIAVQTLQGLPAELHVSQLVFEDDAAVEQSVAKDAVAGLELLCRERYLRHVVFSCVRILRRLKRLLVFACRVCCGFLFGVLII